MMNTTLRFGTLALVAALLLGGCAETKEDKAPTTPEVSVHGAGFADVSSANFHATYIQGKNFDLSLCKTCDGGDFSGGTSGKSCNTCHSKPGGPENCTVCHGSVNAAPPFDLAGNVSPASRAVGAHQVHLLGGIIGAKVACTECHVVPAALTAAGHIDNTLHAEVRFDSSSVFYKADAVFSGSGTTATCSNTYCHGNFPGGNGNVTMTWSDTDPDAAACGTCHGDVTKATLAEKAFPKSGHPAIGSMTCNQCHSRTVNNLAQIIDPSRHVNGVVD